MFSLRQLSDRSWGVFLKPSSSIFPSDQTLTGTGQVTLVAPDIFEYCEFTTHAGTWGENARVDNPKKAYGRSYISFGFLSDTPKLQIFPEEETLLFSFTTDNMFNGLLSLIDNYNDPFASPNSFFSNPGNDISIADFGNGVLKFYTYYGNYYQPTGTKRPVFAQQTQPEDKKQTDGMAIQWIEEEEK